MPVETLTGEKTRRKLVANGDDSSISSCRTKVPRSFEGYWEDFAIFKKIHYSMFSRGTQLVKR
jgi:hypothetical protein